MTDKFLEVDYLVIGGGAMSAAFIDALLDRDRSATIAIIERRDRLGGHWNNAYPFVRLHQPAAFYGVNSIQLGKGGADLSALPEIQEYYHKVTKRFEKSGQVSFYGGHEYLGDNKIAPIADPENITTFKVNKRLVNGTYMAVEIPSVHPPKFEVADDIPFMPLNDLITQYDKWEQFYVLGCGKTGMDAVLFLLRNGVAGEKIHWVMPNDSWCLDRDYLQVGRIMGTVLEHSDAIIKNDKAHKVFEQLERVGGIIRIDKAVAPTKWKCATVSPEEMAELEAVQNRIRKGRIKRLTRDGIEFADETIAFPQAALFVNCTADALAAKTPTPIFSERRIDLQSVFFCQQVFGAAAIAGLETSKCTDKMRNWIKPVPHPDIPSDWPSMLTTTLDNALKLHAFLPLWMMRSRLFYMSHDPIHVYLANAVKAFVIAGRVRRAAKKFPRTI